MTELARAGALFDVGVPPCPELVGAGLKMLQLYVRLATTHIPVLELLDKPVPHKSSNQVYLQCKKSSDMDLYV